MEDNIFDINNENTPETQEKKIFEKFLLQINRIKIIDYLQIGLITPDKYLSEECEKDIQSRNKELLVVSEGYIQDLNEEQILIELILTNEERENLHILKDVYYFDFPLPISRIKKVYVQDKQIIKHMDAQIKNSDCGFLHIGLFDVYTNRKNIIFEKKEYLSITKEVNFIDFMGKIRKYDKRMGMFSFMKNTNFYYCDEISGVSNYSEHYFSTLSSLLNEKLEDNHFEQLEILKENEEFRSLLYSENQIEKEFISKISQTIENEELKTIFQKLTNPTGALNTLSLLYEKDAINLYLIGLVFYFRQKNANKKDSFKTEINNYIPSYKVAELSLAVLGIYLGYSNIRACEKIDIKDKAFKKFFGTTIPMKFTLESKLDFITIETIYNYCFKKQRKGYEFEYLPYPEKKEKAIKKPIDKRWYEVIEEKNYYDKQYIKVKKNSFEELVIKKLEKKPEILTSSKDGLLLGFILKKFPDIIHPIVFGETLQISCNKADFIARIRDNTILSKQDLILDLIELNGKL